MDKQRSVPKRLSKKAHAEFADKVGNEGFWYYLTRYTRDYKELEGLGFNAEHVRHLVEALELVEEKIMEGQYHG